MNKNVIWLIFSLVLGVILFIVVCLLREKAGLFKKIPDEDFDALLSLFAGFVLLAPIIIFFLYAITSKVEPYEATEIIYREKVPFLFLTKGTLSLMILVFLGGVLFLLMSFFFKTFLAKAAYFGFGVFGMLVGLYVIFAPGEVVFGEKGFKFLDPITKLRDEKIEFFRKKAPLSWISYDSVAKVIVKGNEIKIKYKLRGLEVVNIFFSEEVLKEGDIDMSFRCKNPERIIEIFEEHHVPVVHLTES